MKKYYSFKKVKECCYIISLVLLITCLFQGCTENTDVQTASTHEVVSVQAISSEPGGIKLIRTNHPNLWYNQSEIEQLRKMILIDKSPPKLSDIYHEFCKGKMASYPPYPWSKKWKDCYSQGYKVGINNMEACISYMIEPTQEKAYRMKDVIFAFMKEGASRYIDPQNCGHTNWSLAWMYDLTYNSGVYTEAEKGQIEDFFSDIASLVKSVMGNGYRDNRGAGVTGGFPLANRHVHEVVTRSGYPNWYAFVTGGAVCAALNGNDQDLLDFFTKSKNTKLYTNPYSQGVTLTSPDPDTCYVRDLYQYVNGMVFPSGATFDYYQRDIDDSNYPGPKSSYTAAECTNNNHAAGSTGSYNEFSLAGIYLGLEAAAHNGWNGWYEDMYNGKPAMQRAIDFQIQYHHAIKKASAKSALCIRRFYTADAVIRDYFMGTDDNNIDKSTHIFGDIGRIFCYPMYDN